MVKKIILISLAALASSALIVSFFRKPLSQSCKEQLTIVCTTTMITDLVKNIAGDSALVKGLMGPGIDPHLYRPRESDVRTLTCADIIFYNGLHLEGKMGDIFSKLSTKKTFALSDYLAPTSLKKAGFDGVFDPHIWFDVSLWKTITQEICATLTEIDHVHAAAYEKNTAVYLQKLDELDQYIKEKIAQIPQEQRTLITAHDAFEYFGRAYGVKVMGLQGLSTEAEISVNDVQSLAQYIASHRIKSIFAETSIPKRNLQAVQNAVAKLGWNVHLGPELYSDALGNINHPTGTYIGMMRHNIDAIQSALS